MSEKKPEGLSVEMVFAQVGVDFTEIASPMGPLGALQVTLTAPAGQPPATLVLGVPAARRLRAVLDVALRERLENCTDPGPVKLAAPADGYVTTHAL